MAEILTTTINQYLVSSLHLVFDPTTGVLTQAVLTVQRIKADGTPHDNQSTDLLNVLTSAQRTGISNSVQTLANNLATSKGVTLTMLPTA